MNALFITCFSVKLFIPRCHIMCSSLCLYLESCSPTGEDDTSDFCRCFVAGHILPDIFFNFLFPVEFGEWISSRIVLSASLPTLFPGESASCSFWGMVFLLDGSVLILIQPCFLGRQQAVPFGVWIFSISVAPSLSCKHSLCYFQVSGGPFAGSRISVAPSLSCKYSLFYFQVSGCAFAGPGIQFGDQDLNRTFAEL